MEPAKLFTIEQIIRPKGPATRSEVSEVVASSAFSLEQIVLPKGPQPAVAATATLEVDTAPVAIVTSDTAVIDVVASDPATTAVAVETVADKPAN